MRAVITIFSLAILIAAGLCTAAERDIITQYYMAVGDYYDVPYETVYDISSMGVADDQVPVVFFIAKNGKVSPSEVAKFHKGDKLWNEVAAHFNVKPSAFHIAISGKIEGTTCKQAVEKFRNTAKAEWDNLFLQDKEIVSLVNLRFLSEHYGEAPERIIKLRDYATFVSMNNWIYSSNEKTRTHKLADESAGE